MSDILENRRGNYRVVTDKLSCDLYQLDELSKITQIKRKEDFQLFEKLEQRGYMEASGYAWAQPKAAELDIMCQRMMDKPKELKKNA